MKQVELKYKKEISCNLCDKVNEGQQISISLPILEGIFIYKVFICESCWAKSFKEFSEER